MIAVLSGRDPMDADYLVGLLWLALHGSADMQAVQRSAHDRSTHSTCLSSACSKGTPQFPFKFSTHISGTLDRALSAALHALPSPVYRQNPAALRSASLCGGCLECVCWYQSMHSTIVKATQKRWFT